MLKVTRPMQFYSDDLMKDFNRRDIGPIFCFAVSEIHL